jgi:hypothetical protein
MAMRQFVPIPDRDRPRAAAIQNNKCVGTARASYKTGQQVIEICGNPITSESAWLGGRGLICADCIKNRPEDELSYSENG